ncbi:MAG: sialidase [Thermogemmata sp.]|nr:sialidase [Gemmataceae bacterium]
MGKVAVPKVAVGGHDRGRIAGYGKASLWLAGLLMVGLSGISTAGSSKTIEEEKKAIDPLGPPPPALAPFFRPPSDVKLIPEKYRSPLLFDDGSPVRTSADWLRRREQIRRYWWKLLGDPPALLDHPQIEYLQQQDKGSYKQFHLRLETAPGRLTDDAYLLVPKGQGVYPAVIVVFYDAKTGIGEGKRPHRDYARLLVQRGFVALSLGSPPETYYPNAEQCRLQPLAFHAYEAANACRALQRMKQVDARRIGIVGHSYGGKWAMFAACLYDDFAAAAWSDPGIVFDERRPNVNYWERWYLGFEPGRPKQRPQGVPSEKNPRTGPYKQLIADQRDLHELHALMAPRPFLVSGGAEDPPERWSALVHSVAVNQLLGLTHRVAMTHRSTHDPTAEANELLAQFFEWALQAKNRK